MGQLRQKKNTEGQSALSNFCFPQVAIDIGATFFHESAGVCVKVRVAEYICFASCPLSILGTDC